MHQPRRKKQQEHREKHQRAASYQGLQSWGGGWRQGGSGTRRERVKKKNKKYYGLFLCDLTFSNGLQTQPERAGASSGTVNMAMYFCSVWAACGDPPGDTPSQAGRGSQPKGDWLGPSLQRSPFAFRTPRLLTLPKATALGVR